MRRRLRFFDRKRAVLAVYLPLLGILARLREQHRIRLRATRMTSPDIRAGVALLIAAMSAEGRNTIQNIDQIDRGYCNIDGRLNALGARITRCEECG